MLLILSGCGKPSSVEAIETALNRCAKLSAQANSANLSADEAAYYIATEGQKVDIRDCPADFRQAYQRHFNAWDRAAYLLPSNTPLNAFLEGIVGGASGNLAMIGKTSRETAEALNEVSETYYQLVEIAAAYGARVPRSGVYLD